MSDTPHSTDPTDSTELARRGRVRNLIELNLAVVLFGGTGIFAKLIPLPVPAVIFGRSAVAAASLLVFALLTRTRIRPLVHRDLGGLVLVGVLMAVHWVTYFQAVRVSTVAVGTISLHTYPIMTVLVEPIVERKKLHVADVLLAVIVLAGVVVLVPEFSLQSTLSQGVLWGILSAMLFTARNLISRRFVRRYGGPVLMFYQTAVAALVLLPVVLTTVGMPATVGEWPRFLLLGTVFTALNQSLYASSLRHLSAKTVSIIATLLPLYAAIIAIFVVDEIPSLRTIIGGLIVVGAVMIETARATGGGRRGAAGRTAPPAGGSET